MTPVEIAKQEWQGIHSVLTTHGLPTATINRLSRYFSLGVGVGFQAGLEFAANEAIPAASERLETAQLCHDCKGHKTKWSIAERKNYPCPTCDGLGIIQQGETPA